MDIGVAGLDVEELVEMGVHRHDGESPLVTKSTLERIRRFSLFMTLYSSTNSDKLSDYYLLGKITLKLHFAQTPRIQRPTASLLLDI
jgi:hypothetical protein